MRTPSMIRSQGRTALRVGGSLLLLLAAISVAKAEDTKDLPPLAAGSQIALLPPGGSAPQARGRRAAASGDTGAALQVLSEGLRRKGFKVLTPQQVSARLAGHSPEGCRNPATCDPELARATLGVAAAISTAVWQRDDSSKQVVVHVRRERGFGQAEVSVGERGLREAASAALSAALEDSQRTHEVMVEIETEPSGAKLLVDRTLSARSPARIALLPGNHLLSVEAPGRVSRAQYIDVPEHGAGPVRYRLQLLAAGAAAAQASGPVPPSAAPAVLPEAAAPASETFEAEPPRAPAEATAAEGGRPERETSSWNYALAIGLFAVAVPMIANAIYSLATRGKCVGETDAFDRCAERVTLGPAFYTSVGVGGAALLGGTTFLIVRPLSSERDTAPRGAALLLQRTF
jgi:hypothetical protein